MKINRMMTNICSDHLAVTREFYTALFKFDVAYESDWFIHLVAADSPLELGIIQRTHDIVPEAARSRPEGFYITFVVDDADAIYAIAQDKAFDVVSPPEDTFYGQRRLLLRDPEGTLVDVSSLIKNELNIT